MLGFRLIEVRKLAAVDMAWLGTRVVVSSLASVSCCHSGWGWCPYVRASPSGGPQTMAVVTLDLACQAHCGGTQYS
jgi:hypothetical protein